MLSCTNCRNNNSQERVDVNEIFNDNDDFDEYLDEDTDGEADHSSEEELFDHDKTDND